MSNIFAKLDGVDNEVETDFNPGGGILDTDIYMAKIKTAYIAKAASSEARSVNLLLNVGGREVRSQVWVTNRQGEATYKDKKTGEAKNLPGFSQINSLCMLIVGKELGQMDVNELTVKLYDFDAKKELPQAVDCFTELHGEEVQIALQRQTVDKTVKNDKSGVYEATGEVRDQNEVIKFFPADKRVTISEVSEFIKSLGGNFNEVMEAGDLPKAINKMEDSAGQYAETWLKRNHGQVYNKSSGKAAGGTPFAGKATGAAAPAAKKNNLFDD